MHCSIVSKTAAKISVLTRLRRFRQHAKQHARPWARRTSRHWTAWLIGISLRGVSFTCRIRTHRDLRHATRRDDGAGYIFAALHAHQIGAAMCGDVDTAAMVSRSGDGAMIVPTLIRFGIRPIRGSGDGGSTGVTRKGGARAMIAMTRHMLAGGTGFLAVDGPNGPRGCVQRGVSMLAKKSGRPVFAVIVVPRRRWILSRTWDRLQIPKPFTAIDVHFSRPLHYDPARHTLESFAGEVQSELRRMEHWYDPAQAVSVKTNPDQPKVYSPPPSRPSIIDNASRPPKAA